MDEAINANKIQEARREYYEREWDLNPVATEAVLRELAPGVPVPESLFEDGDGLPAEWFGVGPRTRKSEFVSATGRGAATTEKGDGDGLPWVKRSTQAARRGRITLAGDE